LFAIVFLAVFDAHAYFLSATDGPNLFVFKAEVVLSGSISTESSVFQKITDLPDRSQTPCRIVIRSGTNKANVKARIILWKGSRIRQHSQFVLS